MRRVKTAFLSPRPLPGLPIKSLAARTADYLIKQSTAVFQSDKRDREPPPMRRDLMPPISGATTCPAFKQVSMQSNTKIKKVEVDVCSCSTKTPRFALVSAMTLKDGLLSSDLKRQCFGLKFVTYANE